MAVEDAIRGLVDYAADRGLIEMEDRAYASNLLLESLGMTGPLPTSVAGEADLDTLLALLEDAGCRQGVISDTPSARARFGCHLMGLLTPRPSEIARRWCDLMSVDPEAATDWFYRLSCDCGYVHDTATSGDIRWVAGTRWGDLDITINRSKPEKDPRDIARTVGMDAVDGNLYPPCELCQENVGYPGREADDVQGGHPARQNLRTVPLELGGRTWGLQYSPYRYYTEHCIAVSPDHTPMHIDRGGLERLLDCVDLLPHYFMGSNADLPLVGGSILSHDHFQGGRQRFPLDEAAPAETFALNAFPAVSAEVVRWPATVLRLRCADREPLLDAATRIIDIWRGYDDREVGIISHTGTTRHNTVTPIAHRAAGRYRLDLALRCNRTDDEHPLGVFHPHEALHHIKKENIGLIEVMGLAILPPRLERELTAVADGLLGGADLIDDPLTVSHAAWASDIAKRHPELDEGNAQGILRQEVGQVFAQVLECTGVFKWDEIGREALRRFLERL